jgi:hypothetical protein
LDETYIFAATDGKSKIPLVPDIVKEQEKS